MNMKHLILEQVEIEISIIRKMINLYSSAFDRKLSNEEIIYYENKLQEENKKLEKYKSKYPEYFI